MKYIRQVKKHLKMQEHISVLIEKKQNTDNSFLVEFETGIFVSLTFTMYKRRNFIFEN